MPQSEVLKMKCALIWQEKYTVALSDLIYLSAFKYLALAGRKGLTLGFKIILKTSVSVPMMKRFFPPKNYHKTYY